MRPLLRLLLATIVGLLLVGVAAILSGHVVLAATSGTSMEPTHVSGDLVVLGASGAYERGDVVAYRVPATGRLVLHRIIGGDRSGFTMKGDNNESIDPYRPAAADVVGRELLHVPRVGRLLTSPLARGALVALVLVPLGLLSMDPARNDTRPSRRTRATRTRRRIADIGWKLLLALDAVLLASLGVLQLAASANAAAAPAQRVVEQTAELGYHAVVAESVTYPDGSVATGEPVFTRLVDQLDIDFRHVVDGPGAVRGSVRVDLELSTASGWESTVQLVRPHTLGRKRTELQGSLVLADLRATADGIAEETGVPVGVVDVVLHASGEATLDDGGSSVPFDVELAMQLTPQSLTVVGDLTTREDRRIAASTSSFATSTVEPPAEPGWPGLRTPLVVALVLSAASTVLLWPQADEDDDLPVTAVSLQLPHGIARIQVADAAAVARIASSAARPVVRADGWEGVVTGDVLYWHDSLPVTSAP